MAIQNFNIKDYVLQYVPPFLRKAKLVGFLRALVTPLVSLRYQLLTVVYPAIERRTRYNSQVVVFESLLNYEFGYKAGEITIQTDETGLRVYIYNTVEERPKYAFNASANRPLYINNRVEYDPAYDFIVRIPQALYETRLNRLRGVVDKYKLAGVKYNVVAY